MTEKNWIEQAVEKAVAEVLQSYIPQLQRDLAAKAIEALAPEMKAASQTGPADLLKAISKIHAGSTQREILRALLDHAIHYSGRAALFVIKAGAATGWQGRAFLNQEDIKDFPLDVSGGIASRAMQARTAFRGSASEIDSKFIAKFGAPADDRVLLLPLVLKERVAALVYVDAGSEAGGKLDAPGMELLVLAASAWLEVVASRKQVQKEGPVEAGSTQKSEKAQAAAAAAAYSSSTSAFHDPFASHEPQPFATVAAPAPAEQFTPVTTAVAVAEVEMEPASVTETAEPTVAPDNSTEVSQEDAEIHRKAQRFARLLVDEIKLYNQAKVSEGRKNKDLYDRLKDDIDKSQITYQKRYGATAAANADYFNHELVRSLAEDDTSVMGENFQR